MSFELDAKSTNHKEVFGNLTQRTCLLYVHIYMNMSMCACVSTSEKLHTQ